METNPPPLMSITTAYEKEVQPTFSSSDKYTATNFADHSNCHAGSLLGSKPNQESQEMGNKVNLGNNVNGIVEGLQKAIDPSNKGYAILEKMGYKLGEGLGKTNSGIAEPIQLQLKNNRSGLGHTRENGRTSQDQLWNVENGFVRKNKKKKRTPARRMKEARKKKRRQAERQQQNTQRLKEHFELIGIDIMEERRGFSRGLDRITQEEVAEITKT